MKTKFKGRTTLFVLVLFLLSGFVFQVRAEQYGQYGWQKGKSKIEAWQINGLLKNVCFSPNFNMASNPNACKDHSFECVMNGYGACMRTYCIWAAELDPGLQPTSNYYYFCEPDTPSRCKFLADAWKPWMEQHPDCRP